MADRIGIVVHAASGLGFCTRSQVLSLSAGDIASVDILDSGPSDTRVYFEIRYRRAGSFAERRYGLPIVHTATMTKSVTKIYGKRIIIIGGGAQVGQVAIGAISEADRHNIRGEHISVDTIPLVGEQALAEAVRAVANLPRARALCSPDRLWAARSWMQLKKFVRRDCWSSV